MPYTDFCSCSELITSGGSSTCNGDCIFAPHMLLAGDSSIGPCAETKTVLFDTNCLDFCGCGNNTPTYEIETYSDILTNVSINENGITFTSNGASSDEYIAEITYIIRCGNLSDRGSLTIVFKDLCYNQEPCQAGYECDKCTGNCVASGADLDVT